MIGIINEFNEYSKLNELDIYLNNVLMSPENITVNIGDHASTVESLLLKESTSYDLFMMSALYTNYFYQYVEDLSLYVSPELVKKYSKGISSSIGVVQNKLIGLVNITFFKKQFNNVNNNNNKIKFNNHINI